MDQSRGRRRFLREVALGGGAAGLLAPWLSLRRGIRAKHWTEKVKQVPEDLAALRDRYDLSGEVLFLNHASVGTMPRAVRLALQGYLEICETNPWFYMWGEGWRAAHDRTRVKAAAFMGCAAEDLAITHNTTEGFNILAAGLDLRKGDEVLFSSLNHAGASVCWEHHAAARGYRVKTFDIPLETIPAMTAEKLIDAYASHLTKRTRVLVFPHIDNMVGLRHPVARLTRVAKERGVRFVAVDGAQSLGMIPIDVNASGVDFYAVSAHKWLQGPKGKGFLYVARDARASLRPMWVTWGQQRWQDARKYEDYGTRDMAQILALEDAVDFQNQLTFETKTAHYRTLWEYARTRVTAMPKLRWRSPQTWEMGCSLFAVEAEDHSSKAVFEALFADHGVVFRAFDLPGLNTMRLSPNLPNTVEELDRFFHVLGKYMS